MRTMINFTGDVGPTIYRKGGGGGGTTTTVSGVPDQWKPYVTRGLQDAEAARQSGALSGVAALTPEQQDAYNRKLQLGQRGGVLENIFQDAYQGLGGARDAASGTGLFGPDALQREVSAITAGGAQNPIAQAVQQYAGDAITNDALGGALGSARAQQAREAGAFKTAADVARQQLAGRQQASLAGGQALLGAAPALQQAAGAGVAATEGVGSAIQQQQQNEVDARYQGLQRFFGLLGSGPVGSQSTATTTGGGGK